jgi:O-antigen/teichoic acid export membrane protein
MLQAANQFKPIFKREIIFQILRIVFVSIGVFLSLRYSLSNENSLAIIILLLSLSLFITSIFLFFNVKRIYKKKFESLNKKDSLNKKEKKILNNFIFASALLAISGTFFGNIDRVMLGKFVSGEFIGYYTSAFSLVAALTPLISFSAIALLPIFSKLKGKRLEEGFKKSLNVTLLLSFAAFLATLIVASLAILIIYGREYIPATNILRVFAILLFIIPLIALYQSYYLSQGNQWKLAKFLGISTILNVILNYILITSLLKYSPLTAVYGAAIATILSQLVYILGLVFGRNKSKVQN